MPNAFRMSFLKNFHIFIQWSISMRSLILRSKKWIGFPGNPWLVHGFYQTWSYLFNSPKLLLRIRIQRIARRKSSNITTKTINSIAKQFQSNEYAWRIIAEKLFFKQKQQQHPPNNQIFFVCVSSFLRWPSDGRLRTARPFDSNRMDCKMNYKPIFSRFRNECLPEYFGPLCAMYM